LASFQPAEGTIEGGTLITITGSNFFDSGFLSCRFDKLIVDGIFIDSSHIACNSPAFDTAGIITVEISENRQQWTSDNLTFKYTKPESTSSKELDYLRRNAQWIAIVVCLLFVIGLVVSIYVWNKRKRRRGYNFIPTWQAHYGPVTDSGEVSFKDIKLGERIGRGSAGDVFKATWLGTEVAVKLLPSQFLNKKQFNEEHLLKEAALMKSLRHPNVLQFLGVCTVAPNICIIMEYMPLGSLYRMLHSPNVSFSMERIKSVCIEATKGLSYLHNFKPPIIHRDLKSHNLLVDYSWRVKVGDFGLSRIGNTGTMTACGTPCWTAPEVLRNQPYSEKADIYSLGIVFWECTTREDPFEGMPPFQVVFAVGNQGLRPSVPSTCPYELASLILETWEEDPEQRPSVDKVLERLENIDFTPADPKKKTLILN